MIGGDVANAVAAGLHAVHFHFGKLDQHVGDLRKLRPVQLQILPRGEVAVAAIVFARDGAELPQLAGRQCAVRYGDGEHVGVELQIEPVHQAKRLEIVPGKRSREPARDLAAFVSSSSHLASGRFWASTSRDTQPLAPFQYTTSPTESRLAVSTCGIISRSALSKPGENPTPKEGNQESTFF